MQDTQSAFFKDEKDLNLEENSPQRSFFKHPLGESSSKKYN